MVLFFCNPLQENIISGAFTLLQKKNEEKTTEVFTLLPQKEVEHPKDFIFYFPKEKMAIRKIQFTAQRKKMITDALTVRYIDTSESTKNDNQVFTYEC